MSNSGLKYFVNEFAKEDLMARGAYNLFAAWGMSENDHTKLLVAILKYNDTKGKYSILKSFLSRFAKFDFEDIENVKVKFNHGCTSEGGFIDGLIMFTYNKSDYAIIIENKIYDAPDQNDQVRRYIKESKKILKIDSASALNRIWVFYITRDGSKMVDETSYKFTAEPSDTNIGDRFVQISYKKEIIGWLKDDVLGNTDYPKSVTAIVNVYLEYLENKLINNSYMSAKSVWLLEQMGIATELREISKQQLVDLYTLRKEIYDSRKSKKTQQIDYESLNSINVILSEILRELEELAFAEFERQTKVILDEWTKDKNLNWKVAHRGVREGQQGYLQIRLVDDWATVHMEWIPIGVEEMLFGNKKSTPGNYKYYLELHIEGSAKNLKQLMVNEINSSLQSEGFMRGRSRIYRIEVVTDKPFARMSECELKQALTECYIEKAGSLFNLLIEYRDKYQKS